MAGTATKSKYFWKENFEDFATEEAVVYHYGVTQYPFNLTLYDRLMTDLLEPIISGGKKLKILDAGGGTGKWSIYFARCHHNVTLIDVAHPMLEEARKQVAESGLQDQITIHHGTITDLPYEDKRFDFIFSDRNPISHSGRKEEAYQSIRGMFRVLKDGGRILGCVLNKHRKVAQLTSELKIDEAIALLKNGDIQRGDGTHTHYFSASELKTTLYETGFKEITMLPTTAFTEMIPTAWLLDEIPLRKCLQLEIESRKIPEVLSYGVRFHFLATK